MPNPKLVFAIIVLVAASAYAGSATVSGCADYAVALGNGPNYDVSWMRGVINSLAEYSGYKCTGSNISDNYAWFYVSNYASRLVNWACIPVGVTTTLYAVGTTSWYMIRSGFFDPFLAKYDVYGNYRYLGYCRPENVVYSYQIKAFLEWP
ncbi:hypothetical protein Pogu_0023 [Pyrobaculum oguniense TE7]|uniref:Uncharacterized protein n=1 Tax=Pyrobaculum oguniense (strain DSM 13380 / JCM 10595 / TE7) TaxID=698757 RepID=H6Q620_PYROT|nr:hypothetical protein Pogu_0023 [Pyrobaculum oguniense TE7]